MVLLPLPMLLLLLLALLPARYAAVLMTFLSSAFFFSEEDPTDQPFWLTLWGVFVSALFANVLLLPFKHLLPSVALRW